MARDAWSILHTYHSVRFLHAIDDAGQPLLPVDFEGKLCGSTATVKE